MDQIQEFYEMIKRIQIAEMELLLLQWQYEKKLLGNLDLILIGWMVETLLKYFWIER
jgi:hypothetical protein